MAVIFGHSVAGTAVCGLSVATLVFGPSLSLWFTRAVRCRAPARLLQSSMEVGATTAIDVLGRPTRFYFSALYAAPTPPSSTVSSRWKACGQVRASRTGAGRPVSALTSCRSWLATVWRCRRLLPQGRWPSR
ncbi:MAG: hypothetical protein JWL70_1528 [Acidimicrobiia bacterium]|nr:hypothetical protein [Acidimicrobiia bacterium]